MKLALLATICVSVAHLASAQGFNAVYSKDGTDVWAVGNGGNVFRSFDGGLTWGSYPLGTATIRSIGGNGALILMAGDDGVIHRSSDNGGTFSTIAPGGTTSFRAVSCVDPATAWIAGDAGILFATSNGGASWIPLSPPTSLGIRALRFTDAAHGWLVGEAGLVMRTANGGISWNAVPVPGVSSDLTGIAVSGSTIWISGMFGTAARSTNDGATWNRLKFQTDVRSDVNSVAAFDGNNACFVGGGGFVRRTNDGGATSQWGTHALHAPLSGLFFYDAGHGWAVSDRNNVVLRTNDGGATWSMPSGTQSSFSWTLKQSNVSGTVRGDAFSISAFNRNAIYIALGTRVFATYDRGETWTQVASMPSPGTKVNSFYVSPKDSNTWVAAFGSPDRIVRTTNRGVTWTATLTKDFTEYGMPLEMDGSHPDTLFFGPEDGYLYRSVDFGATWVEWSHPNFRSPCDFVVVRDSAQVMWCGDGITGSGQGQMFRSVDHGKNWTLVYSTTGSEIPTIGSSNLDRNVGYATSWSGGGVRKTSDLGASWSSIASTSSTWGADIARDDPNVVMYGVYSGGTSYLSANAGASFTTAGLSGSNYALLAYDRATFLAAQSTGVYKLGIVYTVPVNNTQVLSLLSPNGGETWQAGTIHQIAWSGANVSNVKLEYKLVPGGPWQTIATSLPATPGQYDWLVPYAASSQVRVRVSDAADASPGDSSNAVFTITSPTVAVTPQSLGFGSVPVLTVQSDTIRLFNFGSGTLVISSVTTHDTVFRPGRTSFTIPAGASDTLAVAFRPAEMRRYTDTLKIITNDPSSPTLVVLSGAGIEGGLPIQLASFTGTPLNNQVQLAWTTLSEVNNFGFEVQMTSGGSQEFGTLPGSFIPGSGTTNIPHDYGYAVASPPPAAYYRLKQTDLDGSTWFSEGIFVAIHPTGITGDAAPVTFALHQSYPNPFNPAAVIAYDIPVAQHVKLEVFDVLGERVAMLVDEEKSPGRYTAVFMPERGSRGNGHASGVYFYRLTTPQFQSMGRMMFVK